MKLCQKCVDAIKQAVNDNSAYPVNFAPEAVPESECEFWAHKEARELRQFISREFPPLLKAAGWKKLK